MMSLPLIYTAALVCALLFALARGSREAHLIAAGYVIAQLTSMVAHQGPWGDAQIGVFVTDLLLLGWLAWIISWTSLTWPIALGTLQTLTVLGHLARLAVPAMEKMGYFVLIQWTAWPAFIAIVVGTILDWRAGRTSPAFSRMAALVGRRTKRRD